MSITEFRRRCANRTRLVRVAETWKWVEVSSRMAEHLYRELDGAVTVDDEHDGYAYIAAVAGANS